LFLLRTSVCVNNPASSDALTNSSFAAGILIGAERIVTQPLVPLVVLIRSRSDVENANFADGWPPVGVAGSLALSLTLTSGFIVCVLFPHDPSVSDVAMATASVAKPASVRRGERNVGRETSEVACT
jgi:hypothetical protein